MTVFGWLRCLVVGHDWQMGYRGGNVLIASSWCCRCGKRVVVE